MKKYTQHLPLSIQIKTETEVFSFYRNPGADLMLQWEEINVDFLVNTKIFHFGTLSMTEEEIKNVNKKSSSESKRKRCVDFF